MKRTQQEKLPFVVKIKTDDVTRGYSSESGSPEKDT